MVLNIFKLEYNWFEGEHDEILLAKEVEQKEFEKDLVKAKKIAKGHLPDIYEQIIEFLIKKGYSKCKLNEDSSYIVNDDVFRKVTLIKLEKKTETRYL